MYDSPSSASLSLYNIVAPFRSTEYSIFRFLKTSQTFFMLAHAFNIQYTLQHATQSRLKIICKLKQPDVYNFYIFVVVVRFTFRLYRFSCCTLWQKNSFNGIFVLIFANEINKNDQISCYGSTTVVPSFKLQQTYTLSYVTRDFFCKFYFRFSKMRLL